MPMRLLALIACALWLIGAQAATAADATAAPAASPVATADITARADKDEQFVQAASEAASSACAWVVRERRARPSASSRA